MFYPPSMNSVLTTQELTIEELRILKTKKVGDYFAEALDSNISGDLTGVLTFDNRLIENFSGDFDRLFKNVKGLQGLSQARSFYEWWQENKRTYLTRPVVASYRQNHLSLGDFFDDLHLHFIGNLRTKKASGRISRQCKKLSKNKAVLTVMLFISLVIQKCWAAIVGLIVMGPGVLMVNSYTQPVITPLAQTASQTGAKDLGQLASSIQGWLTHRDKLKKVRQEMHAVTDDLKKSDFSSMSPVQAQARWEKFEQSYFSLFLRYNQALPSHLRDGRSMLRELMIFTPIGLASNLSTFDTQYWIHRNALEALTQREALGASLNSSERGSKRRHKEAMDAAESRIAGALAAWKLYEFMYPELNRPSENHKIKADLQNSYKTFAKSMRFEMYIGQFKAQIDEVLKEMDSNFLMQDRLAQSKNEADPLTL